MTAAFLTARAVEVDLGGRAVLTDISLSLPAGRLVALVGPNGAGKTTLLRALAGLVPAKGAIDVGGDALSSLPLRERARRFAYLPQGHIVHWPLPAGDVVALGRYPHGATDPARLAPADAAAVLRAMQATDVVELRQRRVTELSGGERSRVALAKLTLQGSNLLILDEPTNHLDLPSRQFLEEVLADFEGTLLFVSHDRYFIDRLATKVWAVEEGVLIPYLGNYTDYRTRKRPIVLDVPAPLAAPGNGQAKTQSKAAPPASKTHTKRIGKVKQRTVEDAERDIEKAEERVKAIEEALSIAALNADAAQLTQLSADYDQARAQVDALLAEWEQLAEPAG